MKEDVACLLITNYFFLVKCTKTDHKSRQKAEKDFNRQYKPKKIDPPQNNSVLPLNSPE